MQRDVVIRSTQTVEVKKNKHLSGSGWTTFLGVVEMDRSMSV
jgi:hypothetical protein